MHWARGPEKLLTRFLSKASITGQGCTSIPAPHMLAETTHTTSPLPERQFTMQEKISHLLTDPPGKLKSGKADFLPWRPLSSPIKSTERGLVN